MDEVDELLGSAPQAPPKKMAPQSTPINMGAMSDTLKMLPQYAAGGALGLVKGVTDYGVGAAQNLANLPFMPDAAARGVDQYIQTRNQAYQEAAPNAEQSVQIGRLTGNIAPVIPLAMRSAPSLLGRMTQNAKVGAGSSSLLPYEGDPENFWLGKGIQTGLGGAIAFAAPAVIEPLVRAGSAAINALAGKAKGMARTLTGQTSESSVTGQLQLELQRNGIEWASIPDTVRSGLVAEAQRALRAGTDIDPQAITRLATARMEGVELTQGQATRNPLAWSREQNLARTEPGQPLAQRFTEQNARLVGGMNQRVAQTGAETADPYDVGSAALTTLRSQDAAARAGVSSAYDEFRSAAGAQARVPTDVIEPATRRLLREFGDTNIPSSVISRMHEYGMLGGQPSRAFTLGEADDLLKLINNNRGAPGSPQSVAMGRLDRTVKDAIDNMAASHELGGPAAELLGLARSAASARFANLRETPALADAVDLSQRLAPEKFVEKYIISPSASIDDVTALMRQFDNNPSARMQIQGQVMDYLRRQAINNATDETAKFSQAAFRRALDRVGDRKLNVLFGEVGAKSLRNLQRTAELTQVDPVASGVNRSWTAPAALDFMDQMTRLPVLGAVAGKPSDIYRGFLSAQAINQPLGTPQQLGQGLLSEEMLRRLVPRIGLLSGPLGPLTASGLINQ